MPRRCELRKLLFNVPIWWLKAQWRLRPRQGLLRLHSRRAKCSDRATQGAVGKRDSFDKASKDLGFAARGIVDARLSSSDINHGSRQSSDPHAIDGGRGTWGQC
ncbi:hypothetical protein JCM7447_09390 [Corynebacterium amycolatum]